MDTQPISWPEDDLGPASVTTFRLPEGCRAVVVVDNLTLGPAIGGLRLSRSVTATEVARLARAMTLKSAAAGLPHGGAKAGVTTPRDLDAPDRERVMRAFARGIEHLTAYVPGPDMGTDETAMAWIHDEIGRAVGLPAVLGGIPLDQIGATGFGLAVCAEAVQSAGVLSLAEARVAVQGFGAVGRHAALALGERGARVVAVSDSRGAVWNPDGLDVAALVSFKADHPVNEFPDGKPMPRDDLFGVDCEILVPAAQPDVIHEGNEGQVRARVILQGANIPVTPAAEAALQRRGVLSVPDFLANAGGVICASVEYRGGTRAQAFVEIDERIRANISELLDRTRAGGVSPRRAGLDMAVTRLASAQSYRRRF
jgi:glutamate dehydrogenase/leucine dehydrogenase